MSKKLFLLLSFFFFAAPAFAAGPEVFDSTKEEAAKPAPGETVVKGTIQAACAPWQGGYSIGIALENHIGATIYMSIDGLPDMLNTPFKAGVEERKAGTAVIYRCDEQEANCNQFPGTVSISYAKNPVYKGAIKVDIEGAEPMHFEVKRIVSTAKCDG